MLTFKKDDPIVQKLKDAGYRTMDNPYQQDGCIITFPVAWNDVEFDTVNGLEVNLETAIDQLNRYKLYGTLD